MPRLELGKNADDKAALPVTASSLTVGGDAVRPVTARRTY